jgi:hypothetical protein
MRDPLPHQPALLVAGVFLFVLVEQNQQVNVLSSLEVQIQVAVAAALSLATPRIRDARFPHTAEARNHRAPVGPLQKLLLNRAQQFDGSAAGELVKPPRECRGLDKLHNVTVPQCGMTWQVVAGRGRPMPPLRGAGGRALTRGGTGGRPTPRGFSRGGRLWIF